VLRPYGRDDLDVQVVEVVADCVDHGGGSYGEEGGDGVEDMVELEGGEEAGGEEGVEGGFEAVEGGREGEAFELVFNFRRRRRRRRRGAWVWVWAWGRGLGLGLGRGL